MRRDGSLGLGKRVRGGEKDFTCDDLSGGRSLAHLPLRERLVAAHGWSREAAEARSAASRHAGWLVQLERLEAPATLLDACGAAMDASADHARESSALAYALLGRDDMVAPEPEWPSPVDIEHRGGVELAPAVARDGCIPSTLLAAHTRVALRGCEVDAVCRVLRGIAQGADQRAAFAWRALAWLLEATVADGSRAILVSALAAVVREAEVASQPSAPSELGAPPRLGRLSSEDKACVTATILREVVEPRLRGLSGEA